MFNMYLYPSLIFLSSRLNFSAHGTCRQQETFGVEVQLWRAGMEILGEGKDAAGTRRLGWREDKTKVV